MQDIYVYSPADAVNTSHDIAISISNVLASDPEGDTGDVAQAIANQLGALVFAQRRPYSGATATFDLAARHSMRQPDTYTQAAVAAGKLLANACTEYGVTGLIHYGHSAASGQQTGIVLSETAPSQGLLVTDPSAMQEVSPGVGQLAWAKYTLDEARHKPSVLSTEEAAGYEQQHPTPPQIFIPRQLKEIFVHGPHWRSDHTLWDLEQIAQKRREVTTHVVFPEHSLNDFHGQLGKILTALDTAASRYRNDISAAPFEAEVLPGAWHSTFNKPAPIVDLIEAKFADFLRRRDQTI